ncbi:unnamed protein product [Schistocephalus solidus]|uniref:Phosphoserine phosphatase n=1 Tax=Schistocephalus solidus TaxID=70667 RepID=A0A183S8R9_SCHSO|nr:unnamed protein product [Schistocephalus solidus]
MAVDFSKVAAICFDVDSTVCTNEGIDELAAHMGKADTRKAMAGEMDFTSALTKRLHALQISRSDLDTYLSTFPLSLTPGISMKSFHVKNVRAICFDVDSTVCTNDGLDALGQYMGKAQLIADM